jgi:serine/threonine-protein kinase
MVPTLLNHRYRIIQKLGEGGFGQTFLAEDTQMPSGRRCVIKQLKPLANNPQVYQIVQERFQREAAILEGLGEMSRQIPRLYAYFVEVEQFYLVQEWIEGQTLTQKVQTDGLLSEAAVRQLLLNILPVFHEIHRQGIIHRDIKPDNIMLRNPESEPVLIDFGAVKEVAGTVMNSQGQTTSSIVIGSPGFMPSEQAAGRPVYSSDLYSLGLTVIYTLTGIAPTSLETEPHTGEIVWRKYAVGISDHLAEILDRAIRYHPRDRYPSAQTMLAALQTPLSAQPTQIAALHDNQPDLSSTVPPTQLSVPVSPPRHRLQLGAIIGLLGFAIIGLAMFRVSRPFLRKILNPSPRITSSQPSISPTTQPSPTVNPGLSDSPRTPAPTPSEAPTGGPGEEVRNLLKQGRAKMRRQNFTGAVANFSRAIQLQPDDEKAYILRANAYFKLRKRQAAFQDCSRAVQLKPDEPNTYVCRGIAYFGLQNRQAAITDFNRAIQVDPNHATAYYVRGIAYRVLGNKSAAIADFQKAAQRYKAQGETQDYQDALKQLRRLQAST